MSLSIRQLGELGFGSLQNWDVAVGIFPESQEILRGGASFRLSIELSASRFRTQ